MEEELKIDKLKSYFNRRDDVAMAFLFGSRAKNTARGASDWDIGIYFAQGAIDNIEHEIWLDLERITGAETDLVVLNRAPVSVAWSVVRGESLVIKDRKKYLDFLIQTSHEANDWYRTAEDYHRVFARS